MYVCTLLINQLTHSNLLGCLRPCALTLLHDSLFLLLHESILFIPVSAHTCIIEELLVNYTGEKKCLFICTMRQTECLTFYRMVRCSYHTNIHHYHCWSRAHEIFIALLVSVLSSSSSFLIFLPQQFFDLQHLSREGGSLCVLHRSKHSLQLKQQQTKG